ncbi:hypothetical protein ACTJLB_09095 [Paraburkholderia sp. 22098]|uniref:hypothetical protein n=1 Tax=Paraburkholderia sp. 22098 TaxID=3453874 RepID=UPI003F855A0E
MKVKRLLLGSCLFLVAALARAQAQANPPVLQVFDQGCIADAAKVCFDRVYPPQYTFPWVIGFGCNGGAYASVAQYYTSDVHPPMVSGQTVTCTRRPVTDFPQVFTPLLQACETDARVHYDAACKRDVPVAQLVHTLDVDLQKLLAEFCATYGDAAKCANIAPIPAQGK